MALLLPAIALANRPNIVLIISDDQAYRDFGFMGNTQVNTPHLDRLAKQSAFFPNGYVPSSVCSPSLATLLTGRFPHQHGIHFNHPPCRSRRIHASQRNPFATPSQLPLAFPNEPN